MNAVEFVIRNAVPHEYDTIGKMMVQVYSQLPGFPNEFDMPQYYRMLTHVGDLTQKPGTEILVAVSDQEQILGAVVFYADIKHYGSGGIATHEINAAGFRLLAVDPKARGLGIGRSLTQACIQKAKSKNRTEVIIHSTRVMQIVWSMYEQLGFKRSEDLDFVQGDLEVSGFRLSL